MGNFNNYTTVDQNNARPTEVSRQATWLQGYLQASIRGVNFFTEAVENTGGRRISSHAFPGRDDIYHQDLGRAARTFRLSAYIVGDNYYQHREDLIAALEAPGVAKLVHPYRGVFQVVVKNFREMETTQEGRVARFDIELAEQKIEQLTVVTTNTTAEVVDSKINYLAAVEEVFLQAYNIAQMPVNAIQDAVKVVDQLLGIVGAAKKVVASSADFTRELSNAKGKSIQVTLDATLMYRTIAGLINYGTDPETGATVENALEQLREITEIYNSAGSVDSTTSEEVFNQPGYAARQIQELGQQAAVAAAVGLTAIIDYESTEEAQEVQDTVLNFLDTAMAGPYISDLVYTAARAAKSAIVEDMEKTILDLSNIVDFNVIQTTNTLSISNTIYGEIEQEADIIQRNSILDPFFISSAEPLRVAINGS